MEQVFLDLSDKEMVKKWDDFCLYESGAWFWHTTDWMQYTLQYRLDRHPKNASFMVMDEGQIVAIVPLIIESYNKEHYTSFDVVEFSYGAGPIPAPIFSKYASSETIDDGYKIVADRLVVIARENYVQKGEFQYSALCDRDSGFIYNDGILPTHTQILSLDRPFPALLRQMRKGHISAVKHGMALFNIWSCDSNSYGKDLFKQYESLHAIANGRICRSHATFEMQHVWSQAGNGILFSAIKEGTPYGFIYVFLYKNKAYFGSACNDPQYRHLPIGHALQGAAIQRLCLHGYKQYELGAQYGPDELATDKERNIAHFKHGFGGVTVPVKQWKKEYGTQIGEEQTSFVEQSSLNYLLAAQD